MTRRRELGAAPPPPACRVVPRGAGDPLRVLAESATILVDAADTAGAFSLVELTLAPGGAVAAHRHDAADEAVYALAGTCQVRVGDATWPLRAGDCAYVARGAEHALRNSGRAPARLLLVSGPATSRARLFVELAAGVATGSGLGVADLSAALQLLAARRGVTLGTPPAHA